MNKRQHQRQHQLHVLKPKECSIHECFTQSSFFQLRLRLLLRLLLPSLEPIFRDRDSARGPLMPLIPLGSNPDCRRGGADALKASSGARCERALRGVEECISIGRVAARVRAGNGPSRIVVAESGPLELGDIVCYLLQLLYF